MPSRKRPWMNRDLSPDERTVLVKRDDARCSLSRSGDRPPNDPVWRGPQTFNASAK